MKKNYILLTAGIVLTVLFIILSSDIYESIFYSNEFSNEMYQQNLYVPLALITSLTAWGFAAIFYYVINSVSFSRWYHWLSVMVASLLITGTTVFTYSENVFGESGLDFTHQLLSFTLIDVMIGALLFIAASFSVRWWSSNCRHTPIPE